MDFRLIVTQVVYDREAQIGEKTISSYARLGNTAEKKHPCIPDQTFRSATTGGNIHDYCLSFQSSMGG